MKTMTMLMTIALVAPAMALELPDPMGSTGLSVIDNVERLERLGGIPSYSNRAPQVVVPIPPSESGPSYYTPSGVMTDKQFCNYVTGGGLRCYSR